jgi:hypothetical protein
VLSTRAGPEDLHSIVDLLDTKADVVEVCDWRIVILNKP